MNDQVNALASLTEAWETVQYHVPLRPIRTDADLASVRALGDMLADVVGDNEAHPLYSLFDIAMDLIERWEEEHVALQPAPPREILRQLLQANNLKQKDLSDIASATLVSDILSGRRDISKRLARSLAQRFRVDIALFI